MVKSCAPTFDFGLKKTSKRPKSKLKKMSWPSLMHKKIQRSTKFIQVLEFTPTKRIL